MKTRNLKTKTLSILLTIVMLLGMLPMTAFAADVAYSYQCATLYSDGTLEIFADSSTLATIPWQNERTSIKKVVFTVDTPLYSRMFSDCSNLAEVTLPSTITEIPQRCFNNCTSLTSIAIPDSVTSIGERAFSDCKKLSSITFGVNSQLQTIGNFAFNNCDVLESIAIPNSVASIGDSAFNNCDALASIVIPDSVTLIGERAFSDSKKLSSITFGVNSQLQTIENFAFNNCDGLTSIAIPNSVASIGDSAFYHCDVLESITIPNSVASIGDSAFRDCDALASIVIPDSVTSISNGAFFDCDALANIVILDSVASIGSNAFYHCDVLESIVLPDSVTSIGGWAFNNCNALTDIYYEGTVESWNSITKERNAIPSGVKINHTGSCVDADTNHICDICRAELTHDYSTEWKSDGTNHWHECSCGAKSGEAAHSGGTATCTEKAVCTVCAVAYGELADHTFGTEWKADGTNHWHECTCGAKSEESAHSGGTATCKDKATCSVCGQPYGEALGHDWGNWISNGDGTHTHTCAKDANHTETENCSGGIATCTEKAVCTVCAVAYGDTVPHTFGTEWKSDGTNHWHECTCGAKSEEATHSGGTATCKDKAVCSVCTAAYGEFANHTYKDGKCTVCEAADPNFKPPATDNPQTGDNSHMALWLALLFISGGAVIILTVVDRKRRTVTNK